jgi:hypothetical protein
MIAIRAKQIPESSIWILCKKIDMHPKRKAKI